jgi:hypothetical protein
MVLRVAQFHKEKITRILKIKKISPKKWPDPRSEIRKKIIPESDPGCKKAPDPGSLILDPGSATQLPGAFQWLILQFR